MANNVTFDNETPEWENTGTEPPTELKEGGFLAGYRPPANYFNWFFNRIYKAVQEIKDKITNNEIGGDVYFIEDTSSSSEEPEIEPAVLSLIQDVDTKVDSDMETVTTEIGNIDSLTTTDKDTVVSAVNSLEDGKVDYTDSLVVQCVLEEVEENADDNIISLDKVTVYITTNENTTTEYATDVKKYPSIDITVEIQEVEGYELSEKANFVATRTIKGTGDYDCTRFGFIYSKNFPQSTTLDKAESKLIIENVDGTEIVEVYSTSTDETSISEEITNDGTYGVTYLRTYYVVDVDGTEQTFYSDVYIN